MNHGDAVFLVGVVVLCFAFMPPKANQDAGFIVCAVIILILGSTISIAQRMMM